MDFTKRNYYLIKLNSYINNSMPHELKSYFNCKVHCKPYRYERQTYYHCVSVPKRRVKNLLAYLKDVNINYKQITEEPILKDGCLVCKEDPAILEAQRIEKELQEYVATRKLQRIKMLDFMTQITDLNIDSIVVSGKNKYGEGSIISVDNSFFMAKLINMCKETLEEGIDL